MLRAYAEASVMDVEAKLEGAARMKVGTSDEEVMDWLRKHEFTKKEGEGIVPGRPSQGRCLTMTTGWPWSGGSPGFSGRQRRAVATFHLASGSTPGAILFVVCQPTPHRARNPPLSGAKLLWAAPKTSRSLACLNRKPSSLAIDKSLSLHLGLFQEAAKMRSVTTGYSHV
jgi:hypothetical protein